MTSSGGLCAVRGESLRNVLWYCVSRIWQGIHQETWNWARNTSHRVSRGAWIEFRIQSFVTRFFLSNMLRSKSRNAHSPPDPRLYLVRYLNSVSIDRTTTLHDDHPYVDKRQADKSPWQKYIWHSKSIGSESRSCVKSGRTSAAWCMPWGSRTRISNVHGVSRRAEAKALCKTIILHGIK